MNTLTAQVQHQGNIATIRLAGYLIVGLSKDVEIFAAEEQALAGW